MHNFWLSEACVDPGKNVPTQGKLEKFNAEEWKKRPSPPLPEGFEWTTIDPTDDAQLTELVDFLNNHYAGGERFRIYVTKEKLRWAYMNPNYNKELFIAILNSKTKKMLATFMGHRRRLMIDGKETTVCMTSYQAVHQKLRDKKMGQLLIVEMLRRARSLGIDIGFYQLARYRPTPFICTRDMMRFINTEKLLDTGYTSLGPNETRKELIQKHALPAKDRFNIVGKIRRMEEKDIKEVLRLYNIKNEQNHKIYLSLSKKELSWLLLPRDKIVMTYVVEDAEK